MSERTDAEILARIKAVESDDIFGFQFDDLASCLSLDAARPFLKPEFAAADWKPAPKDRDSIVARMGEYASFAWEKALDERGLSAARSIQHYRAWLWLIGDDETLAFADDEANFPMYGKPILRRICEVYGFPIPSHSEKP